jgi:hypothetical protein
MPKRQLVGRVEVESSPQRPSFDEEPTFPESLPYVRLVDPADPQGELELRGRLNLRMHTPEIVSDTDNSIGGRLRD